MDLESKVDGLTKPNLFEKDPLLDEAHSLDVQHPSKRDQFIIPTTADLHRSTLALPFFDSSPISTYLCGNSLGLQPKKTREYLTKYLDTWATKGVFGHFKELSDSPLPPWMHIDDAVQEGTAKIVGAKADEVAVMQTLTANLHLCMQSFYRPKGERRKIVIEGRAFPSDHYAVLSQLQMHGYGAEDMLILTPPEGHHTIPTQHTLDFLTQHASSIALVLLPGIQYYTGQFFDIEKITAHAHTLNLTIGWDLAHAAGNVPLQLHDWDADFACWCTYKYLNAGPGAVAGMFIHERHGKVSRKSDGSYDFLPRLAGWWGSSKESRFKMDNEFIPIDGAKGWQLSNPSAVDCTAYMASLAVFGETSMEELRKRSLLLTGHLEKLLLQDEKSRNLFEIITPSEEKGRGAQLSLLLRPNLLDRVMAVLEEKGVVVDERRPDVIRVAPAPLYNTFEDCWIFVKAFREALTKATEANGVTANGEKSVMVEGGKETQGWSNIK